MIDFLKNNSELFTFFNSIITLIAIIIGIISLVRANKNKRDILKIKNSIKNQSNFTGFKDCSDIKNSQANQINLNK